MVREDTEAAVTVPVGELVGLLAFDETLSVLLLKRPRVVDREEEVEVEVRRLCVVCARGFGAGGSRGVVGEGERWRMLSRRDDGESGKTERKAGSRRGVVAVEMREGFFRRRWGDLGPTVAVGETGSLSEDDLRRLWRDRSVWEMILRRGGLRAISFGVPLASSTMPRPPGSVVWVGVASTVSTLR